MSYKWEPCPFPRKVFHQMATRYETTKKWLALSFEGHSYGFDKLVWANTKKRWRCRTRGCNGCIYRTNDQGNIDIQTRTPHRKHCIPESDARAIELVVSDLKMKATTQLTPIPTLYGDGAAMLSVSSSIPSRSLFLVKLIHLRIERDRAISHTSNF